MPGPLSLHGTLVAKSWGKARIDAPCGERSGAAVGQEEPALGDFFGQDLFEEHTSVKPGFDGNPL